VTIRVELRGRELDLTVPQWLELRNAQCELSAAIHHSAYRADYGRHSVKHSDAYHAQAIAQASAHLAEATDALLSGGRTAKAARRVRGAARRVTTLKEAQVGAVSPPR
jgi:hypothetical protein